MSISFVIFDLDETLVCPRRGLLENVTCILDKLKNKGYVLGIASYNPYAERVLHKYDIKHYFDYIEYEDYRKQQRIDMKERMLSNILMQSKVPSEKVLFVDDQVRFLNTAKKLGMSVCLVDKVLAPVHEMVHKYLSF